MTDKFPATIRKNGSSKSITIPAPIADKYPINSTVKVEIEKS